MLEMLLKDPTFMVSLAFFGVLLTLGKKMWGAVSQATKQYQKTIQEQFDEAESLLKKAKSTLETAQQHAVDSQKELGRISQEIQSLIQEVTLNLQKDKERYHQSRMTLLQNQSQNLVHEWKRKTVLIFMQETKQVFKSVTKNTSADVNAAFLFQHLDSFYPILNQKK